ncbi:MAG: preprotein translocase subunit SecY [Nanoarchaeota archaeon]|nr:preprotein translocase subunit SecY [Nanoarchaeota archaeon]MBU1051648.1 preprotein translocase subunit SecY [Nanoarchaeota archaeon]MBU1987939.1 preprotein translocase subunit SecY [Nanoarchaeota archaeon]
MASPLQNILYNLPEVKKPIEKKLSFNAKLKWTLIILAAFFILANIDLYGLSKNALGNLEFLQVILASQFGSIISLGIGPIVMSSIILQLLVGSGILNIDTKTEEGKRYFQGLQKIGVIFFIIFEAIVYVVMGGLQAAPGFTGILIFQLILGGLVIMYMDEVLQKYGFKNGGGVSLFIVAGVSWTLFNRLFQFIGPSGENCLFDFSNTPCSGNLLVIIQSVINGAPRDALTSIAAIVATAAIFLGVVWAQSLKVEIPLTYERVRGYGVKWPLAFFYSSVIPVILVAALAANIQLFGSLIENWLGHPTFLGSFSDGRPISGLSFWISSTNLVEAVIRGSFQSSFVLQGIIHLLFYMTFAAIFSVFWVKTSGMDESSQAKNILGSGLQIPGFRKDPRVLESILKRYIMPLTIMGGLAIGALASVANLLGALTGGTSILLAIMIMYNLYQGIAQEHAVDMHPSLRKFMG